MLWPGFYDVILAACFTLRGHDTLIDFFVVFVSAWEETKTCPACLACPDAKAFSATSFEA